jgi:probable HAF family extracellular repeat protein
VVGFAEPASGYSHAFLWTPAGGRQALGTPGGNRSAANGINNAGQVVGSSEYFIGCEHCFVPSHAFLWTSGGGMIDLGTLGGTESYASAINDDGVVVGASTTAG